VGHQARGPAAGRLLTELDFDAAEARIRDLIRWTPVLQLHPEDLPSNARERYAGTPILLKLENLQRTGSFKVRGAASAMTALDAGAASRGVVTCSSGNHGRAVAYVAATLGIPATVCIPSWVDPVKLDAIRNTGARPVIAGDTYDEAELAADRIAREEGLTLIHPFDDPAVVAGQGTVALELVADVPDASTVVVPLSGGGLVGGIAAALATRAPAARVVAVSAERASVMVQSLRAGRPIEVSEEPTLANALAGGIGLANRVTFRLVREHVAQHVLVSEAAIERGIRYAARTVRAVVEGGGAVGLAALLEGLLDPWADGSPANPIVIVLSGGNIDSKRLADIVQDS
jgi:threonine dehydratase